MIDIAVRPKNSSSCTKSDNKGGGGLFISIRVSHEGGSLQYLSRLPVAG